MIRTWKRKKTYMIDTLTSGLSVKMYLIVSQVYIFFQRMSSSEGDRLCWIPSKRSFTLLRFDLFEANFFVEKLIAREWFLATCIVCLRYMRKASDLQRRRCLIKASLNPNRWSSFAAVTLSEWLVHFDNNFLSVIFNTCLAASCRIFFTSLSVMKKILPLSFLYFARGLLDGIPILFARCAMFQRALHGHQVSFVPSL